MAVEIKEVKSRKDLKTFVKFPFALYKGNRYWVPPLIKNELETLSPEKNPAFEYCEAKYWLAYKDGRVVGRIAGIHNKKFIEKWKNRYASFSWFDFVDDEKVSYALLRIVGDWAESKGLEGIHGPLGFTTFDQQAILIEGYEEMPTAASVYNHKYYPQHMERLGFNKEMDYVEYVVKTPEAIPDKIVRISDLVLKREKLRLVKSDNKKDLIPYTRQVFDVINAAYDPLFYFVELTERQIDVFINKYFSLIQPEWVVMVVDKDDRLVGFAINMPSLTRAFQKARGRLYPFGFLHFLKAMKNPKVVDMYLIGILPEYQGKGVQAIMIMELVQTAIERKVKYGESNSELEENLKVQNIWKNFNARQNKRKRIYLKTF